MTDIGLAVLRLAIAWVFVAHGMHKLFSFWSGGGAGPAGLTATAEHLTALGFPSPSILAIVAGVTQLAGGALVGVGLLTRFAAFALLGYVLLGIVTEHLRWGFFLNWAGVHGRGNGIEYSLVLVGALVCLIFAGAGKWSLDGRRAERAESRAMGRARARGR
jgi:putative oxidoreductase